MNSIRSHKKIQYPPALAVVMASIASAIVVTACGPESDEPSSQASVAPPAVVQPRQKVDAAVAPERSGAVPTAERKRPIASPDLGKVLGIEPVTAAPKATGVGAALGGVAGGVLGHQVGSGKGNTAATVVGAIGGAVAGHQIEKHRAESVVGYRVKVRLDTGEERTIRTSRLDGLRIGDRIRLDRESHLHRV